MTRGARTEPGAKPLETADYAYDLPGELIAQTPLADRAASRLLVLDRETGAIAHSTIERLVDWLQPGNLLVANNSLVIPARLRGVRLPGGGAVEVLLLRREDAVWSALARPAKRLHAGTILEFRAKSDATHTARATVVEKGSDGEVLLRFEGGADSGLEQFGDAPLPPYITKSLADAARYQTIYGSVPGSAAAPTAGLHFTRGLIDRLAGAGIGWVEITLHIGLDTFRPVTETLIQDHRIHREWCTAPISTARAIAECRLKGGRIVAVGTTSARTLETLGRDWDDNEPRSWQGFTDEFILPGHQWKLVDALLTNFHLPRSTLLMLVSALAGREAIMDAYAAAIRERYRFYSFGDAMLIR